MPIPKPKNNEKKNTFIGRCMGNPTMLKEYPNNKNRAGVCYSQWRQKKEKDIQDIAKNGGKIKDFKKLSKLLDYLDYRKQKQERGKMIGYHVGGLVVKEVFTSLHTALRNAVGETMQDAYLIDFSDKEVVYVKGEIGSEEYFKQGYEFTDGEVKLTGSPERVQKKVTYENLNAEALVNLTDIDRSIKNE